MTIQAFSREFSNNKIESIWPWTKQSICNSYDSSIVWPKISIITPSFNQGLFIEETIRSVILQDYPNLEYIIIDGGSEDATIDIIKHYESNIDYWISEPDKGQAHALNKGLKEASGEIINWLNSDDFFEEGALFKIAWAFMNNPNKKCISAKERRISQNGKFKNISYGSYIGETIEDTILAGHIDQPSTFFKSEVFIKLNPINEEYKFCFDVDFWIRFILQFGMESVYFIPDTVVNFRYHNNSKTIKFLPSFRLEQKMIYCEILKQLGLFENGKVLMKDIGSLSKPSLYNVSVIDEKLFIELLGKKYEKYENDKSLELREISAYYLTMKLNSSSLRIIKKAIQLDPHCFINYKYLVKILLKCLIK